MFLLLLLRHSSKISAKIQLRSWPPTGMVPPFDYNIALIFVLHHEPSSMPLLPGSCCSAAGCCCCCQAAAAHNRNATLFIN
jgi:hypothetical protein